MKDRCLRRFPPRWLILHGLSTFHAVILKQSRHLSECGILTWTKVEPLKTYFHIHNTETGNLGLRLFYGPDKPWRECSGSGRQLQQFCGRHPPGAEMSRNASHKLQPGNLAAKMVCYFNLGAKVNHQTFFYFIYLFIYLFYFVVTCTLAFYQYWRQERDSCTLLSKNPHSPWVPSCRHAHTHLGWTVEHTKLITPTLWYTSVADHAARTLPANGTFV